MKLAFKLAYKNLMGAGLRTWLTVAVLSFSFIVIIFINGLVNGWHEQAKNDTINWEIGQGQLQNNNYDLYDPFSIKDGFGTLANAEEKDLTPILIRQATIYPQGRMISVLLKGIPSDQKVLKIPTEKFQNSSAEMPILIGKRMAASAKLKVGDEILLRWRDKNDSFDAANATVVGIFNTNIIAVDEQQIWMPLEKLRGITGLENATTLFIAGTEYKNEAISEWNFKTKDMLLKNLNDMVNVERISDSIIYLLLLAIALLAIFDTQVLSVFRRQREIGTYIALGMTRPQVVTLFTIEGAMNSVFAVIIGVIYGAPFLIYFAVNGIPMPSTDELGMSVGDKINPVFGATLILGTIALGVISSTIVSFLPSRKIATMNPVDALKGKIQ